MPELGHFGRILIVVGIITAGLGLLLLLVGKVPGIGRLPGDIVIRRDGFTFFFPITTSIVLSLVLTLILTLLRR